MTQPKRVRRQSETIEERKQKRIKARRRFKACVWMVIANKFWLEDVGEEELGEDVKRNVLLLMKKKKKDKKSALTLKDKTMLCKAAEERTDEEKQHLYKIIGGLKCFRKYPNDVKLQLAGVSYFCYYPPGRVIVRQDREGHSLYFIMSGEVSVSITVYDPILNEHKTTVVGTMVAGQMFGEVSLLHDIPRTATITTLTDCELITLHKSDFNVVLKSSLQAVWDQILQSMARFRYFDGWDDVSMRECCIYSKMRTYNEGDIVFGDGGQSDNYVHFLLKGQCRCVEQLPVIEKNSKGLISYKLFDREEYKRQVEERKKHRKSILASLRVTQGTLFSEQVSETTITQDESSKSTITISRRRKSSLSDALRSLDRKQSFEKKLSVMSISRKKSAMSSDLRKSSDRKKSMAEGSIRSRRKSSVRKSVITEDDGDSYNELEGEDVEGKVNADDVKRLLGIYKETEQELEIPNYVKIIFMQVCLFNQLACFGLGENMKYRRIVAASSTVDCLLIPRFWIWSKNKGNLWTRVTQSLNRQIPSTEEVFRVFLENRRWGKHKRELVNSLVRKPPCNVMNNVPYSIRLYEDINYGVDYQYSGAKFERK